MVLLTSQDVTYILPIIFDLFQLIGLFPCDRTKLARVYCGYACAQNCVYRKSCMWIETAYRGDRASEDDIRIFNLGSGVENLYLRTC